ncbi:hypothetical protein [Gracilibacillus boraciitolerans]|nr:hypothetical protein [Gracilibacillus boraciitolerans]
MTEQEVYQSILQKMLEQTEGKQIKDSLDFIHQLTNEIKQANLFLVDNK